MEGNDLLIIQIGSQVITNEKNFFNYSKIELSEKSDLLTLIKGTVHLSSRGVVTFEQQLPVDRQATRWYQRNTAAPVSCPTTRIIGLLRPRVFVERKSFIPVILGILRPDRVSSYVLVLNLGRKTCSEQYARHVSTSVLYVQPVQHAGKRVRVKRCTPKAIPCLCSLCCTFLFRYFSRVPRFQRQKNWLTCLLM